MARPDKAAAIEELAGLFRDSNAVLLTEYRGLTVAQLRELRRSLAGNATYHVTKNTLANLAAQQADYLSRDTSAPALARAMWGMFAHMAPAGRAALAWASLLPRVRRPGR